MHFFTSRTTKRFSETSEKTRNFPLQLFSIHYHAVCRSCLFEDRQMSVIGWFLITWGVGCVRTKNARKTRRFRVNQKHSINIEVTIYLESNNEIQKKIFLSLWNDFNDHEINTLSHFSLTRNTFAFLKHRLIRQNSSIKRFTFLTYSCD